LLASDVQYRYPGGAASDRSVLRGATVHVEAGESLAVVGASGSGKTTLLYCLAGILVPDAGRIVLDGHELSALPPAGRARVRLEKTGFVFQSAELVAELTLRENVELPLRLLGRSARESRGRAVEALDQLGISDVGDRHPGAVSGGQAQRCAVARALVHRPAIVLADEPTGSLDAEAARTTLTELVAVCAAAGAALLVVTHDDAVAAQLDRRLQVADGLCRSEPLLRGVE
jgi:putative ABC transport system ATP-binding protein